MLLSIAVAAEKNTTRNTQVEMMVEEEEDASGIKNAFAAPLFLLFSHLSPSFAFCVKGENFSLK